MGFTYAVNAIRANLLLALCAIAVTSCTQMQEDVDISLDFAEAELSDYWAEDAKTLMAQKLAQKAVNTIRANISKNSNELEVEMRLTDGNEVFMALLEHNSYLNTYFFSDGRLSYSSHKPLKGIEGDAWVLAYADQQSYDAAKINHSGDFEKAVLQESPVQSSDLKSLLKLIDTFEAKERNAKHIRIGRGDTLITGSLVDGQQVTFALNAVKGEKLGLALASDKSPLYFTLRPINGADMEYKSWEGILPHTGDFLVTVFSAVESENANFTLRFERD